MDYVLDWTIVAVAVVVLAALEGAVPRSGVCVCVCVCVCVL
jgi:hypothetical protein